MKLHKNEIVEMQDTSYLAFIATEEEIAAVSFLKGKAICKRVLPEYNLAFGSPPFLGGDLQGKEPNILYILVGGNINNKIVREVLRLYVADNLMTLESANELLASVSKILEVENKPLLVEEQKEIPSTQLNDREKVSFVALQARLRKLIETTPAEDNSNNKDAFGSGFTGLKGSFK